MKNDLNEDAAIRSRYCRQIKQRSLRSLCFGQTPLWLAYVAPRLLGLITDVGGLLLSIRTLRHPVTGRGTFAASIQ